MASFWTKLADVLTPYDRKGERERREEEERKRREAEERRRQAAQIQAAQRVQPVEQQKSPSQFQQKTVDFNNLNTIGNRTPNIQSMIVPKKDDKPKPNTVINQFTPPNNKLGEPGKLTLPFFQATKNTQKKKEEKAQADKKVADDKYFADWQRNLENRTESQMHPTMLGKIKEKVTDYAPGVGSVKALDKYKGLDENNRERQMVAVARVMDMPISELRGLSDEQWSEVVEQTKKMRLFDQGGAAVDAASIVGGLFTLGTATAATQAAKQGGKKAAQKVLKDLIKGYIKSAAVSAPIGVGISAGAQKYITGEVNWGDAFKGGVQGAVIGTAVDPLNHIQAVRGSVRIRPRDIETSIKELETTGLAAGAFGSVDAGVQTRRGRIREIFGRGRSQIDVQTPEGRSIANFVAQETRAIEAAVRNNPNITREELKILTDAAKSRIISFREALAESPDPEIVVRDHIAKQDETLNKLYESVGATRERFDEQGDPNILKEAQNISTTIRNAGNEEVALNDAYRGAPLEDARRNADDITDAETEYMYQNPTVNKVQAQPYENPLSGQPTRVLLESLDGEGRQAGQVMILTDITTGKQIGRPFIVNASGQRMGAFNPSEFWKHTTDFVDDELMGAMEQYMKKYKIPFDRTSKTLHNKPGVAGSFSPGEGKVRGRTGITEQVLYHELGHQLDITLGGQEVMFGLPSNALYKLLGISRAKNQIGTPAWNTKLEEAVAKFRANLEANMESMSTPVFDDNMRILRALEERVAIGKEAIALTTLRGGNQFRLKDAAKQPFTVLYKRIADTMGMEPKDFGSYVAKPAEQIASMHEMYLRNRTEFERDFPLLFKRFEFWLDQTPQGRELKQIANERVSISMGSRVTQDQAKGTWQASRTGKKYNVVDLSNPGRQKYDPDLQARLEQAYSNQPDFNEAAGITRTNPEAMDWTTGEQALEGTAGNRSWLGLTGEEGRKTGTFRTKLSSIFGKPQGIQDKAADAVTNSAASLASKILLNKNRGVSVIGSMFHGLNKKVAMSPEAKLAFEQYLGRRGGIGNLGDQIIEKIYSPWKGLPDDVVKEKQAKVFDVFNKYNEQDINGAIAALETLTPDEAEVFHSVRELNIIRNNLNYRMMSEELINEFSNGMHMPRIFDLESLAKETDMDIDAMAERYAIARNKRLDLNPNKRRKQIAEIDEEIKELLLQDPAQASVIRAEIALHNVATLEYADAISKIPGAVINHNQPGYLEIPNLKKYGALKGKFVRKDLADPMVSAQNAFESSLTHHLDQAFNFVNSRFLGGYIGKIESVSRQLKTVFRVSTALGNKGANITMAALNGMMPVEMATRMSHYVRVLNKGGDEMTRMAAAFGVQLDDTAFRKVSGVDAVAKGKVVGKAAGWAQRNYAHTDAAAKVAMFEWQINKGATPQEAARFVNRALPNIGNSGYIYAFFSKMPFVGVAFRAIQPEVYRALGSVMGRRTVPFLVATTLYTTFQNKTWEDVPPEEREEIQNTFGSGQTPFSAVNNWFMNNVGIDLSDIGGSGVGILPSSWSFNAAGIPGIDAGEQDNGQEYVINVDPRRLMGIYSINTGDMSVGQDARETISKILPFEIPTTDGKFDLNKIGNQTVRPIINLYNNRDFRNKSITDPDATNAHLVDPETGVPLNPSVIDDVREKGINSRVWEWVLNTYSPTSQDVSNIYKASRGEENFYGQNQTPWQAVLNFFGAKGTVESSNTVKQRQENARNYNIRAELDAQLEGFSPAQQEAIRELTGYYNVDEKLTGTDKNSGATYEYYKNFQPFNWTEDKFKRMAGDPVVFKFMSDRAITQNQMYGTPIPPYLDPRIPAETRLLVINARMLAPGEDAEADQKLYSMPGYDLYQEYNKRYQQDLKDFYGDQEYTGENSLVKNVDEDFPEKPPAYKAYTEAYGRFMEGQGAKPAWTPAVEAARDQYRMATFQWTNRARVARGLTPIPWEMWNNDTFGYDANSSGGFGFGFGGGEPNPTAGMGLRDMNARIMPGASLGAGKDAQALNQFQQMLRSLARSYEDTQSSIKLGGGSNFRG